MAESKSTFTPDWVEPPGGTIADVIEERGWSQTELAKRLGYTEKHVSQLINGKVRITPDAAQRLHRVIGSTVSFWLALEANYQQHLARLNAQNVPAEWLEWAKEFPLRDLMKHGILEEQRISQNNLPSICSSLLSFFSVASPNEWRSHYGSLSVSFRRSREDTANERAIASWLRLGELKLEDLDLTQYPKYDKGKFEKALNAIRQMTILPTDGMFEKVTECLREAGVYLLLIEAIPRAHVSGVARWIGARPVIQLSLYGKSNDKFWFNFFHEAAHILLHGNDCQEKKSIFLDDINAAHTHSPKESEADAWASNFLIPEANLKKLHSLKSRDEICQFAESIELHPGIVLGRLQHEGIVDYKTKLNSLKESIVEKAGGLPETV